MNKEKNTEKMGKKGQAGEAITWFFATLIIAGILLISIFIANLSTGSLKITTQTFFQTSDVLASKSMFSYMLTKDPAGGTVYSQLSQGNSFNSFNGNLAVAIFRGLYQKDYGNANNIWLGYVLNTGKTANGQDCASQSQFCILDSLTNTLFGGRQIGELNTDLGYHTVPYTSEKIMFNDTKAMELVLIGK